VSIGYSTQDVTARAGSDYTRSGGVVNFDPGQTVQTIVIPILTDKVVEDDETFNVILNRPTRTSISRTQGTGTVEIKNDDILTTYTFDTATPALVTEGNTVTFKVIASNPVVKDTVLNYLVSGVELPGIAGVASNFDYSPSGGQLTIPQGKTEQSFDITFTDDGIPEPKEGVKLIVLDNNGGLNNLDSRTLVLQDAMVNPNFKLGSDKAILKIGDTATILFAFNTIPYGFTASDINVTGGRISNLLVDKQGVNYTATFTPTINSEGSAIISIKEKSYTDASGVDGVIPDPLNLTIDTKAPSVIINSDKQFLRSEETSKLSVIFTEEPSDFTVDDIRVKGGVISDLTSTSSTIYNATFTPDISNSLLANAWVVNKGFTDKSGNPGSSINTLVITGDTKAPTLTIYADKTSFKSGETAKITFKFDESPVDFSDTDIQATKGKITGLEVDGSDVKTYHAIFTPDKDTNNLNGNISVDENSFKDAAGNLGQVSNTLAITGDTFAPSMTLSTDKSVFKAGESAILTFAFNEQVTGFSNKSVSLAGGAMSDVTTTDNKTWSAVFTPTANTNQLNASISVSGDQYQDLAGNKGVSVNLGTKTGNPLEINGDTQAPTLEITADKTVFKTGDTAKLTFTFSEDVKNFDVSDIQTTEGIITDFKADDKDKKLYTATFTPKPNTSNINAKITVPEGGYNDMGNNGGKESSLPVSVDTQGPSVVISSNIKSFNYKNTATSLLTFTFSEFPAGFTKEDIDIKGAVLAGTMSQYDPATKTITIGMIADTIDNVKVTASIAANKYTDSLGNINPASGEFSISGDTKKPTLSITNDRATDKQLIKTGDTATILFKFSEAVTDFTLSDIQNNISLGTLGNLYRDPVDNTLYKATYTPKAGHDPDTDVIKVVSSAYTDFSGNEALEDAGFNQVSDTRSPGLVISGDTIPQVSAGSAALVTFTFDEVPVGFGAEDIKAIGGKISDFQLIGASGSKIYSAIYTPDAMDITKPVVTKSVTVEAGAYTDAAGNPGNSAGYQTPSLRISSNKDTTTTIKAGEVANLTFTFSDKVKEFTTSQIYIEGGSLSPLVSDISGKVYTTKLTPSKTDTYSGVISVSANAYTDTLGRPGSVSNTIVIKGDTQIPVLTMSTNKTTINSLAVDNEEQAATISFAFSEEVKNFTMADVKVTGGTITPLVPDAADPTLYTTTLIPVSGTNLYDIKISVPGSGYSDKSDNKAIDSPVLTIKADTLAPVINKAAQINPLGIGDPLTLQFNEAVLLPNIELTDPPTAATLDSSRSLLNDQPQFTFQDSRIIVTPPLTKGYWS
ncbi:MAG: Ig-like domain-containing protein, partial [Methylococcaceae bacterium]